MEILLNKSFYRKESIKKAIDAFEGEGVANFDYQKKDKYHKIILTNIEESVKENIKEEFCNFVFFEEKNI